MEKWFVIINNSSKDKWSSFIWSDIEDEAEIRLNSNVLKNKFAKTLYKIHFSNVLNRKIWLPFKGVWNKFSSINEEELCDGMNYMIFQSNVKFSPSYLKRIKARYNVEVILYFPDTISKLGIANTVEEFERYKLKYQIDGCYSFDLDDCQKYGIEFFDVYSVKRFKDNSISSDIVYVGAYREEQRLLELLRICENTDEFFECDFNMVGVERKKQRYPMKITYNKYLKYQDVLSKINSSKCILELVNTGQSGNTLRFKEAIGYRKKLLTNNMKVLENKCYNPAFMQVFSSVESIDWEWLKKEECIEYPNMSEFSPCKLIDIIRKSRKYKYNEA